MDFNTVIDILAILFGAGGIGTYLLSITRAKSQNALDLSTAWEKFSAPLMKRLETLEQTVCDQEGEINDLRNWAEKLVRQVINLGGVPVEFVSSKKKKNDS